MGNDTLNKCQRKSIWTVTQTANEGQESFQGIRKSRDKIQPVNPRHDQSKGPPLYMRKLTKNQTHWKRQERHVKEIKGHQLASGRDNKISKKSAHANQNRKRNREHVAQSSLKTKSFFEKQHRHAKITTDVQRRTRERTLQLTPQGKTTRQD
jgi:hypothetical protein